MLSVRSLRSVPTVTRSVPCLPSRSLSPHSSSNRQENNNSNWNPEGKEKGTGLGFIYWPRRDGSRDVSNPFRSCNDNVIRETMERDSPYYSCLPCVTSHHALSLIISVSYCHFLCCLLPKGSYPLNGFLSYVMFGPWYEGQDDSRPHGLAYFRWDFLTPRDRPASWLTVTILLHLPMVDLIGNIIPAPWSYSLIFFPLGIFSLRTLTSLHPPWSVSFRYTSYLSPLPAERPQSEHRELEVERVAYTTRGNRP